MDVLAIGMDTSRASSLIGIVVAGIAGIGICFAVLVSLGFSTGSAAVLAWVSSAVLVPGIACLVSAGPRLWKRWSGARTEREQAPLSETSRNR